MNPKIPAVRARLQLEMDECLDKYVTEIDRMTEALEELFRRAPGCETREADCQCSECIARRGLGREP